MKSFFINDAITLAFPLLLLIYFTTISITGLLVMCVDKNKAKKGAWRVPERAIFIIAAVGGAIGVYVGIRVFHHKSKHKKFTIGIPAIILVQAAIVAAFAIAAR